MFLTSKTHAVNINLPHDVACFQCNITITNFVYTLHICTTDVTSCEWNSLEVCFLGNTEFSIKVFHFLFVFFILWHFSCNIEFYETFSRKCSQATEGLFNNTFLNMFNVIKCYIIGWLVSDPIFNRTYQHDIYQVAHGSRNQYHAQ